MSYLNKEGITYILKKIKSFFASKTDLNSTNTSLDELKTSFEDYVKKQEEIEEVVLGISKFTKIGNNVQARVAGDLPTELVGNSSAWKGVTLGKLPENFWPIQTITVPVVQQGSVAHTADYFFTINTNGVITLDQKGGETNRKTTWLWGAVSYFTKY